MAVRLNQAAYDYAVSLIKNGLEIENDTNNWDEVKPTRDEMVVYLDNHDLDEYGLWFLGIDADADETDPARYVYPYGDLKVIHQSALMVAEQKAGKSGDHEIRKAAQDLLRMIKNNQ